MRHSKVVKRSTTEELERCREKCMCNKEVIESLFAI